MRGAAADAAFLRNQAVLDLHQDHLLNHQITELLEECTQSKRRSNKNLEHYFHETLTPILNDITIQGYRLQLLPCSNLQDPYLTTAANAHVLPTFTTTLVLPQQLFLDDQELYKDNRYFDKRNEIARSVFQQLQTKKTKDLGKVYWRYWRNDPRKIVLLIVPPVTTAVKKKKKQFRFLVQFQMESIAWIPSLRLVPNRNNLGKGAPSVFYNFLLTEDAAFGGTDLLLLHDEYSNYQPTLRLLQIWCLQRGFLRGHDTFGDTELSTLLLHAFRSKLANARMSYIQVVCIVFKLFCELCSKVLVLPQQGQSMDQTIATCALANLYENQTRTSPISSTDPPTLLELWKQQSQQTKVAAVLLDPTMMHNYLGRLSPSFLTSLQRAARTSLAVLEQKRHAFEHLFLTESRFWTKYDAYLHIPTSCTAKGMDGEEEEDRGWSDYERNCRSIVRVLEHALGDRVSEVRLLTTGNGIPKLNGAVNDSDEIPTFDTDDAKAQQTSATGRNHFVLGVCMNSDTCFRIVDRGPPMDQEMEVPKFRDLWGNKAELRRFKDGAIVYAVVWNTVDEKNVRFQNEDAWQGGIVERIIWHILKQHFFKHDSSFEPRFALREMVSVVDGVRSTQSDALNLLCNNPMAAHRSVMKAFEELSNILQAKSARTIPIPNSDGEFKSALGLPLAIDAVVPVSPALRYASLYPPLPHPLLGSGGTAVQSKTCAAYLFDPVEIQLRFGTSSKWPTDLTAIGAAKTAMLIEMVMGIERLQKTEPKFKGPTVVTPSHADVCFGGYVFRVTIRADAEIKLLQSLVQPSPDARHLLQTLRRHSCAAKHHSVTHAVYTSHPSSSAVLRLAQRWLASHLLSDQIPLEALELLVAFIYTSSPIAPATIVRGFERFLHLLASFDWTRQPLVVDPQKHLTDDDWAAIQERFEKSRGEQYQNGPALYIVSPCDKVVDDDDGNSDNDWLPPITSTVPERVVLSRVVALAERTRTFLQDLLVADESVDSKWPAVFQESASSFRSYSALLRVDSEFMVNIDASSTATDNNVLVNRNKDDLLNSTFTRSMQNLAVGPKPLRRKLYRNLIEDDNKSGGTIMILLEWHPIRNVVAALRAILGDYALFLYNELCPEVIAVVWRRPNLKAKGFAAVSAEYMRPLADSWTKDTMVVLNIHDFLREASRLTVDIVTDLKIFDEGPTIDTKGLVSKKRVRADAVAEESNDESDDESR